MPSRDLLRRLAALEEQGSGENEGVRHIILTSPGAGPITGWTAGEVTTYRQAGEAVEACWSRHVAALEAAHGEGAVTLNTQHHEEQ